MIRCVVFDFDGTLVDSNAIKHDSFLAVAGEFPGGAEVMDRILSKSDDATRYQIFDQFVAEIGVNERLRTTRSAEMAQKYSVRCFSEISRADEIPGARAALEHLSGLGLRLFISSATPIGQLHDLVKARGLAAYVANVYGAPASKAGHVRHILRECRLKSDQLVYVGDSDADVAAAAATGCGFVGISHGDDRFKIRPANCIDSLARLAEIIEGYCKV